jgi:hypothetical protein
MDKNCDNCFYEALSWNEGPCFHCDAGGSKWVAVDFLKDVPDDTDSLEGQQVMDQMIAHLERIKPKQGVKYDSGKLQWTLLPFRAINEVLEVLAFGAKKYAADNWKIVPEARTRYVDAAFRHLTDWHLKEKLDGETGKSHLAHAICCLLFLLWFEQEDRSSVL